MTMISSLVNWRNGGQSIFATTPDYADDFGKDVAISGDIAAAGAPGRQGSGAVFVYERDGADVWHSTAVLTAAEQRWSDLFGQSVAVRGSTIAVGAPRHDGGAGDDGAVYLFSKDATAPTVWNAGLST